jgi:hypothetical protein
LPDWIWNCSPELFPWIAKSRLNPAVNCQIWQSGRDIRQFAPGGGDAAVLKRPEGLCWKIEWFEKTFGTIQFAFPNCSPGLPARIACLDCQIQAKSRYKLPDLAIWQSLKATFQGSPTDY